MFVIEKGRGKGKSTDIVRMSAINRIPIMSYSALHKKMLLMRAEELGVTIPEPLDLKTHSDCLGTKVLIDDVEVILSCLLNAHVCAISLSSDEADFIR